MRRATIREFDSLGEKYTNYIAVMDFRFRNLCIKSDPMALLSVKVLIEGELQNIEKCADVGKDNDYQFMVFPKYEEDLGQIAKGILETHPEFKIEGKIMPIESDDCLRDFMELKFPPAIWKNAYSADIIRKTVEAGEPFYCNMGEDSFFSSMFFTFAKNIKTRKRSWRRLRKFSIRSAKST